MLIMQTGKKYDDDNLIISEDRPSFFAMTNFSKSAKSAFSKFQLMCLNEKTLKLDMEMLQEISDFYTKHNLMLSGNMNRVKITDLTKYINLNAEKIPSSRRQILEKIYPLCEEIVGKEHDDTKELLKLISEK